MIVAVALLDASKSGNELHYDIAQRVEIASKNKAAIVLFPELSYSGYNPDSFIENACAIEEIVEFFGKLAKLYQVFIVAGAAIKKNNQTTNSALVFDDLGFLISEYDKIHLFGSANENEIFVAGNELRTFCVSDKKIGLSICYDLRFPELFSIMSDVDVFFCIAAWPMQRIEIFELLLRARAVEGCKPFVASNWTGESVTKKISYPYCGYGYYASGNRIYSFIDGGCEFFELLPNQKNIIDSTKDKRFDLYADFYNRFIK